MSADVGGLRMLARELGEHEQFQVHAHVLNNAANEIWVMQKKLEQHQQMAEKTMQVIALEREENARLRELVRELWRFTGTACKKYPRLFDPAAQGGQMVQLNAIDAFEQRMQELGIEVD